MATLHQLATYCAFANFLDDAFIDCLVCGLRSTMIQKWLLSKKDLTLTTAFHLAQSMEAAEINALKLQNDEPMALLIALKLDPNPELSKQGFAIVVVELIMHQLLIDSKSLSATSVRKEHLARVCRSTEKTESSTPARSTQQSRVSRPLVPCNACNVDSLVRLIIYKSQLQRHNDTIVQD